MDKNYFADLEKIANELMVEDHTDPMVEDPKPALSQEEVEAAQAQNSETPDPDAAEEQLPPSPEDTEALQASMDAAREELQAAEEQLAEAEENFSEFEKTAAPLINDSLPAMGAFAKLIDFSTNKEADPVLHKLAQERLQTALSSEDQFLQILHKTAQELFEDEANLNALYTKEGMDYVTEQLSAFVDDDGLSKQAFDAGSVIGKVVDTVKDYASATKNFWKLRGEVDAASAAVQEATDAVTKSQDNLAALRQSGAPQELRDQAALEHLQASDKQRDAMIIQNEAAQQRDKGAIGLGVTGAGLAGGALLGGKKVYDALHPEPEEELPVKMASDKMNPQNSVNYHEGGKQTMAQTVVQDFLKVAGAAALLNIANDESFQEGIRKEAADQFNAISRMSRNDMEHSFVKVATELYTEDQLHEIVAGHHTEELFDKVAFFIAANDASADELEKVAGADGVAAKGVAGALTDSKKQIEEHVKEEKEKAATNATGRRNVLDPGDTSAYNVVNNPEKYQVDKTAMLEQAVLQKQAAIQAYAEAENYLKQYGQ